MSNIPSDIINRIRNTDPVFASSIVATVVLGYILGLPAFIDSFVVGFIVSILFVGAIYVFYQDFTEKRKSDNIETAKEADLARRKKAQAQAEAETGKCISCLSELPEGIKECPNCGFAVKHYSVEAKTENN